MKHSSFPWENLSLSSYLLDLSIILSKIIEFTPRISFPREVTSTTTANTALPRYHRLLFYWPAQTPISGSILSVKPTRKTWFCQANLPSHTIHFRPIDSTICCAHTVYSNTHGYLLSLR